MIEIWPDGSATHQHERRPGGWAHVIVFNNSAHELIKSNGAFEGTTNNQMELWAIIQALKKLMLLDKTNKSVVVYSDSELAIKCLLGEYKCKNENTEPILRFIRAFMTNFHPIYVHVPAHAGHKYNEMANDMAVEAKNIITTIRGNHKFMESLKRHRRNGRPPY